MANFDLTEREKIVAGEIYKHKEIENIELTNRLDNRVSAALIIRALKDLLDKQVITRRKTVRRRGASANSVFFYALTPEYRTYHAKVNKNEDHEEFAGGSVLPIFQYFTSLPPNRQRLCESEDIPG